MICAVSGKKFSQKYNICTVVSGVVFKCPMLAITYLTGNAALTPGHPSVVEGEGNGMETRKEWPSACNDLRSRNEQSFCLGKLQVVFELSGHAVRSAHVANVTTL